MASCARLHAANSPTECTSMLSPEPKLSKSSTETSERTVRPTRGGRTFRFGRQCCAHPQSTRSVRSALNQFTLSLSSQSDSPPPDCAAHSSTPFATSTLERSHRKLAPIAGRTRTNSMVKRNLVARSPKQRRPPFASSASGVTHQASPVISPGKPKAMTSGMAFTSLMIPMLTSPSS
ncbi:unannotated protein [freshwater metagenome]|uniref:Unannotated protein n=1 Tax=freshwater metagenome TaxID=449393 RepID=A0A6J6E2U2_9ZZZZ